MKQEWKHWINYVKKDKHVSREAFSKSGYPYFHYNTLQDIDRLKIFCSTEKLVQTKRFIRTGEINFLSPKGAIKISLGNYIVKINEENYLILSKEAFHELFFEE
ncbi:hypothetical protein [Enterococcus faecalis]|uniref:hypothetical protein n=1 Tax=Enterococcus faecalis TaxID=1351 RepID=UPI002DBD6F01|nr:hypothetical protein [Enterococcus faecalis]MEB7792085.1 hypothetical protein [Enterococcus faecalis]MEB7810073.1 hypothetical protein [Enterococcus faecalis]